MLHSALRFSFCPRTEASELDLAAERIGHAVHKARHPSP
jgi:cysteine sulfinate desulfinase/cysteine desulfurase-like protein